MNKAMNEQVRINEEVFNQDFYTIFERAMNNVFLEGNLQEVTTKETRNGLKYKVKVKDRSSGSSYIRYATREKIAQLRSNPNIASVELTDHTPSNANDGGVTGIRQDFSAGPNQNAGSVSTMDARRIDSEKETNKRRNRFAAGMGKKYDSM